MKRALLIIISFLALTQTESWMAVANPEGKEVYRNLKGIYPKTHVQIDNGLGEGLQAKVHCTGSLGDDKGEQVIEDGKSYEFEFTPSFMVYTEYNCDFSFRDGAVSAKIYDYERDIDRCYKHCNYRIAKDGVSGYNKDAQADLLFKWGNP